MTGRPGMRVGAGHAPTSRCKFCKGTVFPQIWNGRLIKHPACCCPSCYEAFKREIAGESIFTDEELRAIHQDAESKEEPEEGEIMPLRERRKRK